MERAKGIDVSHYKPIKDAAAVYESGVRFVGIKATEGKTYTDPTLNEHRALCRGERFQLTIYYHFARSGDPRRQAIRFMEEVGHLGPWERLALDLEVSPTDNPGEAIYWVDDFFRMLQIAYPDRRHIIYTSRRIWRMIGDPDWERAAKIDLWAPRYNSQDVEPVPPKPWPRWTFWQWSDGAFPEHVTPGVGKCDINYFRGTEKELEEYAGRLSEPAQQVDHFVDFFKSLNDDQVEAMKRLFGGDDLAELKALLAYSRGVP